MAAFTKTTLFFITLLLVLPGTFLYAAGNNLALPPTIKEIENSNKLAQKTFTDKANRVQLSKEGVAKIIEATRKDVLQQLRKSGYEVAASKKPNKWINKVQSRLNFLELGGYFRVRSNYLYRCDLGTFIPGGSGTSSCPPPIAYFHDPDTVVETEDGDATKTERPHSLFSMNTRLRVNPTLNISEDVRIKGRVDVFDNMVLGSTPNFMTRGGWSNPSYPWSFLSMSQNPPMAGINSLYGALAIKRLFGEVSTPIGELIFGRMPLHFGLGILYNSGDGIDADYGDNIDGILFATKVFGHYIIPAYSVSYTGPVGRDGGRNDIGFLPGETGPRYDLDISDNVHTFFLTIAKKDSLADKKAKLNVGQSVFNYALLTSYRFQLYDSQAFSVLKENKSGEKVFTIKDFVPRNAHAAIASIWAAFYWDSLSIEAEFAGILGRISDTKDLDWEDGATPAPVWMLQGGAALKARYNLVGNRLKLGFDAGIASGDSGSSFGTRPRLSPKKFSADDKKITNFTFNPNYTVDLLLFREVIRAIGGAYYLKPSVFYEVTNRLTIAGSAMVAFSDVPKNTPGQEALLGLEFDVAAAYETPDGFYMKGQFGWMVPFSGLNHPSKLKGTNKGDFDKYGAAQSAFEVGLAMGMKF